MKRKGKVIKLPRKKQERERLRKEGEARSRISQLLLEQKQIVSEIKQFIESEKERQVFLRTALKQTKDPSHRTLLQTQILSHELSEIFYRKKLLVVEQQTASKKERDKIETELAGLHRRELQLRKQEKLIEQFEA